MAYFFVVYKKYKIYHSGIFEMQVCYAEYKVGDGGGISYASYFKIAPDRFHGGLAFQVASFYAEVVVWKFPHVEAQAYYYRQLGVNTRKIAGYDCVESAYNRKLSAVFLGKIAKCKQFSFNNYLGFSSQAHYTRFHVKNPYLICR